VLYPIRHVLLGRWGKKEIAPTPQAADAMTKEWNRLRDTGVWDEVDVREWDDVRKEAEKDRT
ncbi:MAG: hypothetical protein ACPGRV_01795, partial [Candidatus Thalassarchaeaceae archaeon]